MNSSCFLPSHGKQKRDILPRKKNNYFVLELESSDSQTVLVGLKIRNLNDAFRYNLHGPRIRHFGIWSLQDPDVSDCFLRGIEQTSSQVRL